ncbi:MAG: protein kinase domain-containing protein [Pirellulaceae bacterium]
MSWDFTVPQSGDDERQARELSLRHTCPPTQVPGYDLTRFLGSGAYGEVWIGLDRNTGRQVAVKFYQHRGGVDWALLSREVEKLVLLSADRYVVQLLDVGWQADPPFYVMEYIENGSLEQLIQRNDARTVDQSVVLFREIVIGLNHAHAKGILHCDLKPANVLLDQDSQPRLADFGQSRLTHEQTPSLGTLFYMAPEQADLKAVPDARWDVYALGAILYCMLVGKPPHMSEELLNRIEAAPDLPGRLLRYRQWITSHKLPDDHRKIPGVDRALASIVDRCLAPRPSKRFANVQEIRDALRTRDQVRARRPLLLLGVLGPLLLLLVMAYGGWNVYQSALQESAKAVTAKVYSSNLFASKFAAASVATEIQRYFRAVERAAAGPELRQNITDTVDQLQPLLAELADPKLSEEVLQRKRAAFEGEAVRQKLQRNIEALMKDYPDAASLFVCDERGTHLAGQFNQIVTSSIGSNFAYRTYCYGGLRDLTDHTARPMPDQHVRQTSLSAPLSSNTTKRWKIAVSTPLYYEADPQRLLAVLVLTVDVGNFMTFDATETQFAVLVDARDNGYQGLILDHPLLTKIYGAGAGLASEFSLSQYRVAMDSATLDTYEYVDPLGGAPGGEVYRIKWIAASTPVMIRPDAARGSVAPVSSGLVVFVQEDMASATTPVRDLGRELARKGVRALAVFLFVVALLWYFVFHVQGGRRWWRRPPFAPGSSIATPTPAHIRSTAAERGADPPKS